MTDLCDYVDGKPWGSEGGLKTGWAKRGRQWATEKGASLKISAEK